MGLPNLSSWHHVMLKTQLKIAQNGSMHWNLLKRKVDHKHSQHIHLSYLCALFIPIMCEQGGKAGSLICRVEHAMSVITSNRYGNAYSIAEDLC